MMGELAATDSASPFLAILWVFYPMAVVVLLELLLRAFNNDDSSSKSITTDASVNPES